MKLNCKLFCGWLFSLLLLSQSAIARDNLPEYCQNYQSKLDVNSFMLFNKTALVQLGECVAIDAINKSKNQELQEACEEVIEDENNIFAFMSLSPLEAIQIGQCLGAIDHIYTKYNNERIEHRRYYCRQGQDAVKLIINAKDALKSKYQLRELLCL